MRNMRNLNDTFDVQQYINNIRHTLSFFYKGWLIRDGNMRLVEISKFIGMQTSLIEKLRDGGNLLISQTLSLRDNKILITCTYIIWCWITIRDGLRDKTS